MGTKHEETGNLSIETLKTQGAKKMRDKHEET